MGACLLSISFNGRVCLSIPITSAILAAGLRKPEFEPGPNETLESIRLHAAIAKLIIRDLEDQFVPGERPTRPLLTGTDCAWSGC
jgi:hypothetical protein